YGREQRGRHRPLRPQPTGPTRACLAGLRPPANLGRPLRGRLFLAYARCSGHTHPSGEVAVSGHQPSLADIVMELINFALVAAALAGGIWAYGHYHVSDRVAAWLTESPPVRKPWVAFVYPDAADLTRHVRIPGFESLESCRVA